MTAHVLLAHFAGGLLLANALPHLVSGSMGRPFQSPFAKPPGRGLSSPLVNVLWGFFNLIAAYLLLSQVGRLDWRCAGDVVVPVAGGLIISLYLAWHFGRVHADRNSGLA
ncbi:hypothetical protein ACYJW8_05080 [Frateuria aurantia]